MCTYCTTYNNYLIIRPFKNCCSLCVILRWSLLLYVNLLLESVWKLYAQWYKVSDLLLSMIRNSIGETRWDFFQVFKFLKWQMTHGTHCALEQLNNQAFPNPHVYYIYLTNILFIIFKLYRFLSNYGQYMLVFNFVYRNNNNNNMFLA